MRRDKNAIGKSPHKSPRGFDVMGGVVRCEEKSLMDPLCGMDWDGY